MSQRIDPGHRHLNRELLDGFFLGRVSLRELSDQAAEHLLAVCPECRRRVGTWDPARMLRAGATRAAAAIVEEEEAVAELLGELLSLGRTETLVRVARDRRFASVAFARHEVDVAAFAAELGEMDVVDEACRLAGVAVRRLDPGRYGRAAIAWVEAERALLEARVQSNVGDWVEARRWWGRGRREALAAGRPKSLLALQHLVGAEVRLAEGRVAPARALARGAAALLKEGIGAHWRWSILRVAARLDRLVGEPEAATERLRGVFEEARPQGSLEWSVAREFVFALLDEGSAEEAAGWIATWWGQAAESRAQSGMQSEVGEEEWMEAGWRGVGSDAAEVLVLLGGLARRRGHFREARGLLEEAREALLRRGRGAEAIAATVELLRVLEAEGRLDELKGVVSRLERVAECSEVPRRVLLALARFGAAVWSDRVGDLDAVERAVLLHLGTPVDHPAHGFA